MPICESAPHSRMQLHQKGNDNTSLVNRACSWRQMAREVGERLPLTREPLPELEPKRLSKRSGSRRWAARLGASRNRHQTRCKPKAAPADLFSQGARAASNHAYSGGEDEVHSHGRPGGQGTESEARASALQELVIIEAAQTKQPNSGISDGRVEQRDQVAKDLVAG